MYQVDNSDKNDFIKAER